MVAAIETAGLVKRFGRREAVAGVDLHVPAGSIYAFLGRNGAGKTTTIRLILGLMRADAGSVRLFGRDIADRLRASVGVGALVETPSLYDRLTGRENLALTRRLLDAPATEVDRVLEIVDLASAADRLVGGYSLGMRQRLGVPRALIAEPRLLVLDEPGNGLDPDGIRDMRRLIRDLPGREGVTVFVSSHQLGEVEQIATHVALMHEGRILVEDELAALRDAMTRRIDIRVDHAPDAAEWLAAAGFSARPVSTDALRVDLASGGADAGAAARVNALLVTAGFAVSRLTLEEPSLENIYLEKIGGVADATAAELEIA